MMLDENLITAWMIEKSSLPRRIVFIALHDNMRKYRQYSCVTLVVGKR